MAIQLKVVSTPDHLIQKTNEELLKLGEQVIDVEVHREDTVAGGGYSIIKYQPDATTMRRILNEQKS